MKDDRLTWSELRKQVALRAGCSEKEAGSFLTALMPELINGLKNDKVVRLTGLGSFKIQAVAPRRSVNVTTGEPIIIESYNKPVFSAESAVKELVQSATIPAQTELQTPIQKLSAQATEIVDILGELGQSPTSPTQVEQSQVNNKKAKEVKGQREKEAEKASPIQQVDSVILESTPEVETENTVKTAEDLEIEVETKKKNQYRPLRDIVITVFILLLLLCGGYLLFKHEIIQMADGIKEKIEDTGPMIQQQKVTSTEELPNMQPTVSDGQSSINVEEEPAYDLSSTTETKEPATTNSKHQKVSKRNNLPGRTYTEFIGIEYLGEASRLAWVAKKYYGEKDLWVFLYEANMDHLKDPHHIAVDTPIRVPKLSKELLDLKNPQTRALVDQLIELYR